MVAELRADRLEALDLGEDELSARAVFSWSLRALREPVVRLFRLLGLHPGPDIDTHAAAALAGVPVAQCWKLLRDLVAAGLLDEYQPGRFRLHDLLRLFATELAGADDDARRRMLGFYLHTAWAGDRALVSQRIGVELPPLGPVVVPLTFTSPADAARWFTAEHAVLIAMVGHAADSRFDGYAWRLALTMRSYLDTQGHARDHESVYRAAVGPVNRVGDPVARVRVHRGLGRALAKLTKWDEAEEVLRLAVEFAGRTDDRRQQAHCHEALSGLYSVQGRYELALEHALMSNSLHPEDDGAWLASSFALKGRCLAHLNRFDEAFTAITKALELHRGLKPRDETGEAEALADAGYIHLQRGELELAADTVERALALHEHLSNWPKVGRTSLLLSDVYDALGRTSDAHRARERGLLIANALARGFHPSSV